MPKVTLYDGTEIRIEAKGEYKTWEYYDEILVVADKGRINIEDPGADSPEMVYWMDENHQIKARTFSKCLYGADYEGVQGNKWKRSNANP